MTLSSHHAELQKMIKGFRVSDLQTLLIYAGKNKGGKKSELQARALDLLKSQGPHMTSFEIKVRELHRNRYQQTHGHVDPPDLYPSDMYSHALDPIAGNISSMSNHKSTMGPGVGIPNYVQTLNHQMMRSVPALNIMSQFPVNPDVRFKDLPFYDVLNELLKPTSMVPVRNDSVSTEKELVFYLGPQDLRDLDSNTDVQVQFRMGFLESNREQDDDLPSLMTLKLNNRQLNLPSPVPINKPGMEAKRPKRPIDITSCIKRSSAEPQVVYVSWTASASNANKPYVAGVYLVRKQSSSVLIKRLKDIGVKNPDHTTAMIKEKLNLDRDSEIATMSLRGSLICPLGKIKMSLPCRSTTCTHLQCFDAALYIQMNEKKPKWICPVCDKPALFKDLAIDGLFLDITRKVPSESNEVQFHENGSWTPVIPVKKVQEISEVTLQVHKVEAPAPKPKKVVEVVSLDSDSDTEDSWPVQPPKKKPYKPVGIINPVMADNSANSSASTLSTEKPFDPLQLCSSKSVLSSSKDNSLSITKSNTQSSSNFLCLYPNSLKDYESTSYSSTAPPTTSAAPPQSALGSSSGASTFQDTVDVLPSSTAGQCYDFDLYSLIQQNNEDTFQYQDTSTDETLISDDTPDIISID